MNQGIQPPRTIFLACPYGEIGGGMGSIMAYLAAVGMDTSGRFRLLPLETRGGGRLLFSPFFLLLAIFRIFFETIRRRLALVHVNLADGGSVYRKAAIVLASKAIGVPVLLHVHAGRIIPFYNSRGRFGKTLIRITAQSADHCLVLGVLWQDWLVDELGVQSRRVSIVPNGVPSTTAVRPARDAAQPFRVVFVGNLLPDKGVADLLYAFAKPELRNANVTLTLAGGGNVAAYRAVAEQLGIGASVQFTGWLEQAAVRQVLAASDALVLPSYNEGLPLVVLEALASRVPAICTPVGAVPEMFEDGRTALFVPPRDPAQLAARILHLAQTPSLQARLSEEGYVLYQNRFTMEAFTERLSQFYAMLAHPARPGETAMLRPGATSHAP